LNRQAGVVPRLYQAHTHPPFATFYTQRRGKA
jgi:hypothetical protein